MEGRQGTSGVRQKTKQKHFLMIFNVGNLHRTCSEETPGNCNNYNGCPFSLCGKRHPQGGSNLVIGKPPAKEELILVGSPIDSGS